MRRSIKQRLSVKSSIIAELVGTSDYLPSTKYARLFLMKQGYMLQPTVLHHDNESTIELTKNRWPSSGHKTRHVDIRHFLVTDRINKNEFVVKYYPVELMVVDFFLIPLQGEILRKLCSVILGKISLGEFQKNYHTPVKKRTC